MKYSSPEMGAMVKEIIIKTCHGLDRVRFVDGALLPQGVSPLEVCKALWRTLELWEEIAQSMGNACTQNEEANSATSAIRNSDIL